jgi:hypothetical protein
MRFIKSTVKNTDKKSDSLYGLEMQKSSKVDGAFAAIAVAHGRDAS